MSSREAFETGPGEELSLAKRDDGTYISVTTDVAWAAWQAATERAAQICDELRNKIPWVAETQDRIDTAQCCAVEIREGND